MNSIQGDLTILHKLWLDNEARASQSRVLMRRVYESEKAMPKRENMTSQRLTKTQLDLKEADWSKAERL